MKTIYIEKKPQSAAIFLYGKNTFSKINEFSCGETDKYTEFIESLSPQTVFRCSHETPFQFWDNIRKSHNPFEWIQHSTVNQNWYFFDLRLEILFAALSLPKIQERSFREGITFIYEKDYNLFAVLIYKNEIYGAFEHSLRSLTPELLKKDLEEFRYGWLPHEEVLKQNGSGCILKNIPAEAEGFRPTFICCEHKELFPELGRFITLENTKENMVKIFASA